MPLNPFDPYGIWNNPFNRALSDAVGKWFDALPNSSLSQANRPSPLTLFNNDEGLSLTRTGSRTFDVSGQAMGPRSEYDDHTGLTVRLPRPTGGFKDVGVATPAGASAAEMAEAIATAIDATGEYRAEVRKVGGDRFEVRFEIGANAAQAAADRFIR